MRERGKEEKRKRGKGQEGSSLGYEDKGSIDIP
jgi:hypothetical protein